MSHVTIVVANHVAVAALLSCSHDMVNNDLNPLLLQGGGVVFGRIVVVGHHILSSSLRTN
ncbi:hypothetical protein [Paenibacillus sp. NPDC058177]|uniref:hypothetical protein n=1 Tax=Paenibacillus sp. NPDC058177 TaxID=3346369 RepID=UPI0036D8BE53